MGGVDEILVLTAFCKKTNDFFHTIIGKVLSCNKDIIYYRHREKFEKQKSDQIFTFSQVFCFALFFLFLIFPFKMMFPLSETTG
jgi:hypothetical protein